MSAVDPGELPLQWRVERKRVAGRAAVAAVLAAITLLRASDAVTMTVGLVAAGAIAAVVLRDLLVPVRLSADTEGLTVITGLASRRMIPWRAIEQVHVDSRERLGLRQVALEIDEGDQLHMLAASDLGADPHDVAAALTQLRTGR
jgi:hypothetical protein